MKNNASLRARNACALLLTFALGCARTPSPSVRPLEAAGEARWQAGFASFEIEVPEEGPLYIAGYHNGWEISEIRDLQRASALWLDCGGDGVVLVSVDCVGLASDTVAKIRERLADFCGESGCAAVHVIATHDHAGLDTLGLWGPVGQDGKNPRFMESLADACVRAAKEAYRDRKPGRLFRADVPMEDMYRDSREPVIWDDSLHLLRFSPDDGSPGIRLVSLGAHAESLRGANTRLSRDYPGVLCDLLTEETGDRALFVPGAVGGLVMTREFVSDPFDAEENLLITAGKLLDYALSDAPERELEPVLSDASGSFRVPLDNSVFLYYKFLGILGNEAPAGSGETGYDLLSSLSLLRLGDTCLLLLPGEIFPELVFGGGRGDAAAHPERTNPVPLAEILAAHGIGDFFAVGLADDELGYIVTPDDFLTDEKAPYLNAAEPPDGSRHYEETNSTGWRTADVLADALEELLTAVEEAEGR